MNKYGARKTTIHGHTFPSKAEAMRYLVLRDRERKGEITGLMLQPKFDLIVNGMKVGTYTGDFEHFEGKQRVCEETKGVKTEAYQLRAKLFMALHPHIELRVNGVPAKRPKQIEKPKAVSHPEIARKIALRSEPTNGGHSA